MRDRSGGAEERESDAASARAPRLTDDDLYRALTETRRRRALVLLTNGNEWTVGDLATALTGWAVAAEGGVGTPGDRERLLASLVHVDLPLLAEVGLVEYDHVGRTVQATPVEPAVARLIRRSVESGSAPTEP